MANDRPMTSHTFNLESTTLLGIVALPFASAVTVPRSPASVAPDPSTPSSEPSSFSSFSQWYTSPVDATPRVVSPYVRTVTAYFPCGTRPCTAPSTRHVLSFTATNRTTPATSPWPYTSPLNSATAAKDWRSVRRSVPSRTARSSPNPSTSPLPMSLHLYPFCVMA